MAEVRAFALDRARMLTSGSGRLPRVMPAALGNDSERLAGIRAELERRRSRIWEALERPGTIQDAESISQRFEREAVWKRGLARHEVEWIEAAERVCAEYETRWRHASERRAEWERPERGMQAAGVLLEHCGARLEELEERVRGVVEGWLDSETAYGLLINGPVGTGKTRLAAAIMAEVVRAKASGRMVLARRLLSELWEDTSQGGGCAALDRLLKVPWLVIDDLGHEGRVSEAVVGAFHELLSTRCGNYQRTIITTNLSLEEISQQYDASIASRLRAWTHIVVAGKDRRG